MRSEFTVTRLGEALFYLVGTPRGGTPRLRCAAKAAADDGSVQLRNVTAERGCFTVVGPKARECCSPSRMATSANEAFPVVDGQVDDGRSRVRRSSAQGELRGRARLGALSPDLLISSTCSMRCWKPAKAHGLRLVGNRAIESMRLDKSYRAMYRDLDIEHTALESGLERFIKFGKGDFVGREALARQREAGWSGGW